MLRLAVLVLLLANGGYFAWSKGLLAPYGFAPAVQSEPQRLTQQLHPEAIRIVLPAEVPAMAPASAASAASVAATSTSTASSATTATTTSAVASPIVAAASSTSGSAECLQVGAFNEEQTVVLRERLQSVMPAGSWRLEKNVEPVIWMVYMGKYTSPDALEKKRSELRAMRVAVSPLNNPALEPGLSLGTFTNQAEAEAELARIAKRGVRTARVVQSQVDIPGQRLRLPAVTDALRPRLDALTPQLAGKQFKSCT